jgi:hypothetical protein
MTLDAQGLEFTGGTDADAACYREAVIDLLGLKASAFDKATALAEAAPSCVMAQILPATMAMLAVEASAEPALAEGIAAAERAHPSPTRREAMHLAALRAWAERDFAGASRILSELNDAYPRDVLAILAGHQSDFFTGRLDELVARPTRALTQFAADDAEHGFLLGMRAFGLEENGEYAAALAAGGQARDAHADDVWAIHAIAHVHEMRDERGEGVAWLEGVMPDWTGDNFLKCHNFWHLALFRLGRGEVDAVLQLYDHHIAPGEGAQMLDLVDASALLWRLYLKGVDVAARAGHLADRWEASLGAPGHYVFNDMHAAMARVAAGRGHLAREHLNALSVRAAAGGSHGRVIEEVGRPLVKAIYCFGDGRMDCTTELLTRHGQEAIRAGGSHAQRDVFAKTLRASLRAARAA